MDEANSPITSDEHARRTVSPSSDDSDVFRPRFLRSNGPSPTDDARGSSEAFEPGTSSSIDENAQPRWFSNDDSTAPAVHLILDNAALIDYEGIDSPLIQTAAPSPRTTAGPSNLGDDRNPFDSSYYESDEWGEEQSMSPPPIGPRPSSGSQQVDTVTGRFYEPYSFMFSADQTGSGHSDLQLRAPTRASYQNQRDWIAEIERSGGLPPEPLGPRISLEDAIASYVGPIDDARHTAVRQMVISSLEQSWQSGRRLFNFAREE
ncbi:hypothetical protein IAR50_007320 [Cryptococcus sp. DSM 104548]